MRKMTKTHKMAECALLIAAATVLSFIKFPGPWVNGGSITLCSMVPICIIGYRHGAKWGLISGFIYGILQMMFETSALKGITFATFIAAVFLDYIFAFSVLGLSGIFRRTIKNQTVSFVAGSSFAVFLRFICHFISGFLVWDSMINATGISWAGIVFSLQYNLSYMLPELIITAAVGAMLCKVFDFNSINLKKAKKA